MEGFKTYSLGLSDRVRIGVKENTPIYIDEKGEGEKRGQNGFTVG